MSRLLIFALALVSLPAFAQVSVNGVPNQTVGGISGPNGLAISLLNLGDATVSQLGTLSTSNSILAVGTVLAVSDAATIGDVTIGGGVVHELLQCTSIASTHCSTWVLVAGGSGTPSNIVHQWLMKDGSGSVFADSGIGTAAPMTASNITWSGASGFPGTAAHFNGTTSKGVTSAALTGLDGSSPFTYSIWVNIASYPDSSIQIMGNLDNATNYLGTSFQVTSNGAIHALLIHDIGSSVIEILSSTGIVSTGAIHHLVLTYDGSKTLAGTHAYLDGSLVTPASTTDTLGSASFASSLPFDVGVSSVENAHYLNGVAADARIYNVALTAPQVAALFTEGVQ